MERIQPEQKSMWHDAAVGGAIMGVALALADVVSYTALSSGVNALIQLLLLIWGIYFLGKRRAKVMAEQGWAFTSALGFILAMMMFTGVIYGFASFLISFALPPDVMDEPLKAALKLQGMEPDSERGGAAMSLAKEALRNPVTRVLATVFSMVLNGGFVGLFVAPFLRCEPKPIRKDESDETKDNE